VLFVADAGNHRLLGWTPAPRQDQHADIVLGQSDFVTGTEFPYIPQTPTSLRFPYAVDVAGGTMVVADTANNRILVWDEIPLSSTVPADRVLGQPDFAGNGENRWDAVGADTFCWPYGLSLAGTRQDGTGRAGKRLAVADSGNNRVVVWSLP
jgi:DNA-binding beta-propeller fold protein YncE